LAISGFDMEELKNIYSFDYMGRDKEGIIQSVILSLLSFLEIVAHKKIFKERKVLDYGGGNGKWVSIARTLGIESYAYDPYDFSNPGFKIDSLSQLENVSTIRLNHVIEHLTDFKSLLELINQNSSTFANNVVIYGRTPNSKHFSLKIFGKYWGFLHAPFHLNILSENTFKKILTEYGFKYKIKPVILSNCLGYSIENFIKSSLQLQIRGHTKIYLLLHLVLLPLTLLESFINILLRTSSEIEFIINVSNN
jgi:hypothetical protein